MKSGFWFTSGLREADKLDDDALQPATVHHIVMIERERECSGGDEIERPSIAEAVEHPAPDVALAVAVAEQPVAETVAAVETAIPATSTADMDDDDWSLQVLAEALAAVD
jgi:hypothetical protein